MPLPPWVSLIPGPWPATVAGALDSFADDLAAAYSVRRLLSSYEGSALRVRRSSDDAEQDIGFSSTGRLHTQSLLTFCGAGNGFVAKWYDQSGNARDLVQATAGNQHKIVNSGVVKTVSGFPALHAERLNDYLRASWALPAAATHFRVYFATRPLMMAQGDGAGEFFGVCQDGNSSTVLHGAAGTPSYYANGDLFTGTTRNNLFDTFVKGVPLLASITGLNLSTWSQYNTEYFGDAVNYLAVNYEHETIIYSADKSAERAAIEAALGAYYGLPFSVSYTTTNVTVAGQAAQYLVPTGQTNGVLVMYHHGSGETETVLSTDAQKAPIRDLLIRQGYTLCASAAHANNWGNAASVADYEALWADAQTRYPTINKVVFLSQSMGGLSGLTCLADGVIPAAGWYGIYPACNLAAMYNAGAGVFEAAIETAYGMQADGSDYATKTDGYDPILRTASLYDVPMRFVASPDDVTVTKIDNSDAMSAHVAATTPEEEVVVAFGAHGSWPHFDAADVVAFFDRC